MLLWRAVLSPLYGPEKHGLILIGRGGKSSVEFAQIQAQERASGGG